MKLKVLFGTIEAVVAMIDHLKREGSSHRLEGFRGSNRREDGKHLVGNKKNSVFSLTISSSHPFSNFVESEGWHTNQPGYCSRTVQLGIAISAQGGNMGNSFPLKTCTIFTMVFFGQIWCYERDELTTGLAQEIAENYFSTECITVVAEQAALQMFSPHNSSLIRVLFNGTCDSCDPLMNESIRASFREKCSRYIVQISKPDCFLPAWFDVARSPGFERHNPKIIFLPSSKNKNDNYGDALLSTNETNISADILVVERSGNEDWPVTVYTNNFHQLAHERGRSPKIYLDEWNPYRGFRYSTNLFPDKLKDLKQKTLRLFFVPYGPYVTKDPLDGSEPTLIKEFCKVLNCQIEAVTNDDLWGEIDVENNVATDKSRALQRVVNGFCAIMNGQVGALFTGNADVGSGANTVWLEYWPYVEFSDCYMGAAMAVIAPKPTVLGGWFTPFLPFPLDLWLIVFTVVIASAVGLYVVTILTMKMIPTLAEKHKTNATFITFPDSLLRAVRMLVSQQPSNLVGGSPVHYLFTSMEVIYLVITTCYCAQLYTFLTVPRTTKPIDTVEDIVENGLTWLAPSYIYIAALNHADEPRITKLLKLFKAYPAETIIELAEGGGYGIVVERMTGGHYVEAPYITEKFISKSRVATGPDLYGMTPITFFLQKGSPYVESLNRFLGHMQNGGLYFPWEADSARKYLNYTIQAQLDLSYKKESHPPKVLKVADLEGAFLIYIIGLFLATILFCVELHFGKKRMLISVDNIQNAFLFSKYNSST